MSTLDKSFIKAFSKDPGLAASPPEASPTARQPRRIVKPSTSRQRATAVAPANADDPYLNGVWYRLDEGDASADQAAEAALADATTQRRGRNARRPHVRFREETPQEIVRPIVTRRVAPAPLPPLAPVVDEPLPDSQLFDAELFDALVGEPPDETVPREAFTTPKEPVPDISPEALAIAFSVAYTGDWESHLISPPAQVDLWEPTVVEVIERADAEPEVEIAMAAQIPQPKFRVDPPAASAISKPHFPMPVAQTEGPNEKPAALEQLAPPDIMPVVETPAPAPVSAPAEIAPHAEPASPAKPEFQAVWEVERFSWPAACDELLASALDDWGLAVRQLLASAKKGCKTLAVAGVRRGEGRSTLALCLARLAAQTGAQIALVDADFENPQLANMLGVGTECDWKLALADGQPLTEAAIICLADSLTFIPLQQPVPFKQVSFRQPAIAGMIKTAAESFDLVIVDVGPIAAPEYSSVWGGKACPFDGVLLVRDLRRTDDEETAATVASLRRHGLDQVIVMENYVHSQPAKSTV